MEIIKTTIIKTAEESTRNAFYSLEFTASNNALVKVQASVFTLPSGELNEKRHLGYVIFENDNINCSLPGNAPLLKIFEDFELFMELIRDEINPQTATQQSSEK